MIRQPRRPTRQEIDDLIFHTYDSYSGDLAVEEVKGLVEAAYVAVFDGYITTCPGYTGKIMLVVWEASPDLYQVFIWEKGKMTYLKQDAPLQLEAGA